MPTVKLDILARIHEAQLRKTEREAKERFEKLGKQAGEDLARGIEDKAPRIRSAMNSAADAALNLTRRTKELGDASDTLNKIEAQKVKLQKQIAEGADRRVRLLRTEADLEKALTVASNDRFKVNREYLDQEREKDDLQRTHNDTVRDLAQKEKILKDIRLKGKSAAKEAHDYDESLQKLRKRSAKEAADLRDAEWILGQTRDKLKYTDQTLTNFAKGLGDARDELKRTTNDLEKAEKDLQTAKESSSKTDREIARMHEEVEKATRKRVAAVKSLGEAEVEEEVKRAKREQKQKGGGNRRGGGGGFGGTVGNVLSDLPFVPSGGAGALIGGPILVGMASATEAAVTASQTIALLPAIAAAAAAGIGTLALGFSGLDDALKHMSDPKQFAEALQGISPAAQQVALEVKYLVDGPLKDLKQATQETLFQGVPEQLHNLTNTLLPSIQQLTQGVAGSFNNMFMNATNQLMTPETMGSLQVTINNIVQAFQNLEPAVAPFVSAIAKLVETGSTFLPGLAGSITNAANAFNNFITKAQQDGSLKEWIQKGIDAAKTIFDVIGDLGKRIYDTFGNKSPEDFKNNLDAMVTSAIAIAQAVGGIAEVVNGLLGAINPVVEAMGGWRTMAELVGAAFVAWKVGKAGFAIKHVIDLLSGGGEGGLGIAGSLRALPALAEGAAAGIAGAFATIAIPMAFITAMNEFAKANPGVLENSAEGQKGRGQQAIADRIRNGGQPPASVNGNHPLGVPARSTERTAGGAGTNATFGQGIPAPAQPVWGGEKAGLPGYTDFAVPTVESTESKSKQLADMRASLNPADFAVDPFAGMPGGNPGGGAAGVGSPLGSGGAATGPDGLPPLTMGTNGKPYQKPSLGYNSVNDDTVIRAQNQLTRDGWALTDAMLDLEALKKTGLGTQQELLNAEHKVLDKKMDIQEHQASLQKAEEGTWNKIAADKNMFADVLDKDFGISKGLPGIAENMVKYLGSLATAGFRGQLKAIEASDPDWQARLAAKKAGVSGTTVFGQPLPGTADQTVNGVPVSPGAPGVPSGGGAGGAYPGDAALLANVKPGRYSQEAGRDLLKGVSDCSSSIGDLVAILDGKSTTAVPDLTTGNAAELLPGMGFVRGMGGPGDFRVGYNSGHMQATLPGGTPWNWGGKESAERGGIGGTGADDQSFTDHWYRPVGAGSSALGTPGMPGGMPNSSGATPVFVVNMPGAGIAAMANSGQAGMPGGVGGSGFNWDAIAGAEASGNWANKSNEKYQGGLQFDPKTWAKYKPQGAPDNAADATREQQIAGAEALMASGATAASQWPATFKKHPEWFNQGGGVPAAQGTPPSGLGSTPPGLFSPENTNPGLNNPLPDPRDVYTGGGGEGPIFKKPPGPPGMPGPIPFAPGDLGGGGGRPGPGGPPDAGLGDLLGVNPTGNAPATPSPFGPGGALSSFPPSPNNQMAGLDPNSPVGVTGAPPGNVGPFPTPAGVAPPPAAPPAPAAATPKPVGGPAQGGWQAGPTSNSGLGAMAGSAAAMMFPGAGEAAAKAGQLVDRGIKFGGQLAGIGVSGLMETFGLSSPDGGNGTGDLSKSWVGRLASGLAQVSPAAPSTAGQTVPQKDPKAEEGADKSGGPNYSGVVINGDFVQSPDRKNGQQIMNDLALQSHASKGSP